MNVDDKDDRVSGFKALLASQKANSHYLIAPDGDLRLWEDLSADGRLEIIARDAAYYEVPFEPFAEAVRESVNNAAIEEAALRLAMRSTRELHDLECLFPDDGRTESAPPLIERVGELLNAVSSEHEDDEPLAGDQWVALNNEIQLDEAAEKRENAFGMEALRKSATSRRRLR